jgi:hypothetical protein
LDTFGALLLVVINGWSIAPNVIIKKNILIEEKKTNQLILMTEERKADVELTI